MSEGSGTQVTAAEVGNPAASKSCVIKDDYNLVTDGDCYVAHIATYPKSGTHVITIKNVGGAR